MSLNLDGLNAYTDEHAFDLIKKVVLKGRTADIINVQGGIKNSATINKLTTNLVGQTGDCGWSPAGSTVLDQRTINVDKIRVNEPICITELEDFYTSTMMNPGSYNEEIPFEELYAESVKDSIQELVENLIWKGDKTNGTANLALSDGFKVLFDSEIPSTSSYYGEYTKAGLSTTIVDDVDAMIEQLNIDIIDQEDLVLFMSYADYRTYSKALRDANLFHYSGTEDQGLKFSQLHPGTNVRVTAVKGLNGADRWALSTSQNFTLGTDLLNDTEDFRIYFDRNEDEVRLIAKWKQGVEVVNIEHVVWYVGV